MPFDKGSSQNIFIKTLFLFYLKKEDKGSLWSFGKEMTILRKKEARKQFRDKSVYQKVNFIEKFLCELVEKSNSSFKELKRMGCISDITSKYFTCKFKATNLEKF